MLRTLANTAAILMALFASLIIGYALAKAGHPGAHWFWCVVLKAC